MMGAEIEIEIELYGALSLFKSQSPLILRANKNIEIADLKEILFNNLKEYDDGNLQNLINTCAFADDDRIYPKDYKLNSSMKLAILPPVNGG